MSPESRGRAATAVGLGDGATLESGAGSARPRGGGVRVGVTSGGAWDGGGEALEVERGPDPEDPSTRREGGRML